MAETPADALDTIRRAVDLMRKRADAATPGPWQRPLNVRNKAVVTAALPEGERGSYIDGIDAATGERERCGVVLANTRSDGRHFRKRSGRDLEHIASWHPSVAKLVAAWLEAEIECHQKTAELWDAQPAPAGYRWTVGASTLGFALAVALVYLGEEATHS